MRPTRQMTGCLSICLPIGPCFCWYCWLEVITELQTVYCIVATAPTGMADTTRPYDKRTIAADVYELLSDHLGLRRYAVAGRGLGAAPSRLPAPRIIPML